MGVEKLVSLVAAGFLEEFLVYLFNVRILVRTPILFFLIVIVDGAHALLAHLISSSIGLPAPAYTATSACHNLDKVPGAVLSFLAGFSHRVEHLLDISHLMSHCYPDFYSGNMDARFLDS